MNCPKCGADIGNARFCPNCGKKIKAPKGNSSNTNGMNEKPADDATVRRGKTILKIFCVLFAIMIVFVAIFSSCYINDEVEYNKNSTYDSYNMGKIQLGLVCENDCDVRIVSFKHGFQNTDDDSYITEVTFEINLYDKYSWRNCGSFEITESMNLAPGEYLESDHWDYWAGSDCPKIEILDDIFFNAWKIAEGYYTVCIKVVSIEYDRSTLTAYGGKKIIDDVYLVGPTNCSYYYIKRDNNGYITEQASADEDEVPDLYKYDYPYYWPWYK